MSKSHELIKKDNSIDDKFGDFTGPNSRFSNGARKEYLKKYAEFSRYWHQADEKLSKKIISDDRLASERERVSYKSNSSRRVEHCFDTMQASLICKPQLFEGWQFYYNARCESNKLVFCDEFSNPVSCAKYSFDSKERVKSFSFKIFISKEYKADLCIKPFITTTGRIIELRSGLDEVLKLQFYCNGEFHARDGSVDLYHHKNVFISNYNFDSWHDVKLELDKDSYNVYFDNLLVEKIALSSTLNPDTIFFSGGMHPIGSWQIIPEILEFEDESNLSQFFAKSNNIDSAIEELGTVTLPYGTGCHNNKDKYLVLESNFERQDGKAFLLLQSLDPCGEVYINNKKVMRTANFEKQKICIDQYLTKGTNSIKVIVEPRAPELHYSWHKHKDAYNAWVCYGVSIIYLNDVEIVDFTITTVKTDVKCLLNFKCAINNISGKSFDGEWRLYLKKLSQDCDADENEQLIDTGFLSFDRDKNALLSKDFFADVDLWSPESPSLYEVRLTINNAQSNEFCDEVIVETGFRTIEQKDGAILLNGKKIMLNGALIMQFLPPYDDVPLNHILPSDEQIIWQILMAKEMNCNTLRLHVLGYGTNDVRFARFCDRMGIMLMWTTRFIDSIESMLWTDQWEQRNGYIRQIKEVINHPSIVVWEGSNEFRGSLDSIRKIYDEFVASVKEVDQTRLLSPISHIYYNSPCDYFQENGVENSSFEKVNGSIGWNDSLVIRSAHNYDYLCGYGTTWDVMREQAWKAQPALLKTKNHAYLITEFAIIGRQNPDTPEAKQYIKNDSYELPDESGSLGFELNYDEWILSQAHQAICASAAVKRMRLDDIDGLLWCCLSGGANDGSYLKPPIDFYGYPKLAFFSLKEGYQPTICASSTIAVLWDKNYIFKPVLVGAQDDKIYDIEITISNDCFETVFEKKYYKIRSSQTVEIIDELKIELDDGYYGITYSVQFAKK